MCSLTKPSFQPLVIFICMSMAAYLERFSHSLSSCSNPTRNNRMASAFLQPTLLSFSKTHKSQHIAMIMNFDRRKQLRLMNALRHHPMDKRFMTTTSSNSNNSSRDTTSATGNNNAIAVNSTNFTQGKRNSSTEGIWGR